MIEAITEAQVREALGRVMDPEMGHDIVTLGMLRMVEVEDGRVFIHVVPTSEHCPFADEINRRINAAIAPLPGVGSVDVQWGGDED